MSAQPGADGATEGGICKNRFRTYVLSGAVLSLARVIKQMSQRSQMSQMSQRNRISLAQRCLSAVDLAIDFATLGEYGLEPLPTDGRCRERSGPGAGWEARATARRRGCEAERLQTGRPAQRLAR
jgi:hypothetical protein